MSDSSMRGLLLVSDLDGTLVTNRGAIPERNLEAVGRYMSRGGYFAFATGRSVLGTEKFTARLMPNSPSIVYNGGGIYDFSEKKLLWSKSLPREYGAIIREAKAAFPDVGIEIYSGGSVYYINRNDYTKAHIAFQGISASDMALDALPAVCNKILFCGDSDRLQELSAHMAQMGTSGFVYVFSGPIYFEVLPEGISKGVTVRILADLLGVGYDRVLSIGDYLNDLEMLAVSALSAAPEDALEEVRCAADVVVGSCEGGAVADFIEYIEDRFG